MVQDAGPPAEAEAGAGAPGEVAAALALDQWRRWHGGERVPAEEYLERCTAVAADTEAALALIYGELLVREELGERPDPGEYVERFPELGSLRTLPAKLIYEEYRVRTRYSS